MLSRRTDERFNGGDQITLANNERKKIVLNQQLPAFIRVKSFHYILCTLCKACIININRFNKRIPFLNMNLKLMNVNIKLDFPSYKFFILFYIFSYIFSFRFKLNRINHIKKIILFV